MSFFVAFPVSSLADLAGLGSMSREQTTRHEAWSAWPDWADLETWKVSTPSTLPMGAKFPGKLLLSTHYPLHPE